jgi:NADPH:quinone reductase-like Zn-dependent oxidoreductase
MNVIEIRNSFGIEHLTPSERPRPIPGPGEILLRMKAASLNYRDLMTIEGRYNPNQPLPLIPCSDGVGEVVEIGIGVSRVNVGDRVVTTFFQGWISGPPTTDMLSTTLGGPLDGVLAEYMVLREDAVVHVPGHLSDAQAATLPCSALTAWSALVTHNKVSPGDSVLVLGTGGVALCALLFAKLLGAKAIVISSSDAKLDRVRQLGADYGINYKRTPQWGKAVREVTNGAGVNHVIELGGAGTLQESLEAVALGGHISLIGVLAGPIQEINITAIYRRTVRIQGIFVGNREGFEAMNRAIAYHRLEPMVGHTFRLDEVQEALRLMARGGHFGKICLLFDQN